MSLEKLKSKFHKGAEWWVLTFAWLILAWPFLLLTYLAISHNCNVDGLATTITIALALMASVAIFMRDKIKKKIDPYDTMNREELSIIAIAIIIAIILGGLLLYFIIWPILQFIIFFTFESIDLFKDDGIFGFFAVLSGVFIMAAIIVGFFAAIFKGL